ncbi:hypothetical protein PF008_g17926 [Phytophthora fragariae]|uniref:Uncharacterized protein n=1 Tax=Phytophthora fragariae TaxID=53985 RepID=A0A6G0R797_9STRA|nr:hypothetical protein PF008_g17926 [Phytophthora fragariae]
MVDRRHDDEKIEMLTTTKTHLSTGEPMYTTGTVEDLISVFSAGETVAFDEIYPVFVHASGRVTEPDFESSGDVDDFIAALPVKEMREVYRDVCLGGSEECVHNFLWMMRWLRTCMELSEIERPNIRARLRYYRCLLGCQRVKLDQHIERHIAMKADSSVTDERWMSLTFSSTSSRMSPIGRSVSAQNAPTTALHSGSRTGQTIWLRKR